MQLKRILFLNSERHLSGEDVKTYQFFHYIGNLLPEYFDEDDLAFVVYYFTYELAHYPNHLPKWMQENNPFVVAQVAKIKELITVSHSNETVRFAKAYERILHRYHENGI